LVQLKSRLAPFIAGEVEAFREVQTINAQQLAAASFGGVMLLAVGRVYQTEADIHQGNPLMGGLTKLRRAGDNIKLVQQQLLSIYGRFGLTSDISSYGMALGLVSCHILIRARPPSAAWLYTLKKWQHMWLHLCFRLIQTVNALC
jgi:hypothetical protein